MTKTNSERNRDANKTKKKFYRQSCRIAFCSKINSRKLKKEHRGRVVGQVVTNSITKTGH